MAATFKNLVSRVRSSKSRRDSGPFTKAPQGELFPKTNPSIDGEECLRDCQDCTIKLPAGFKIDKDDELYGQVKGWSTHLIVATGKTDWVRDVADEEGSVMEVVGKGDAKPVNGRLMLSASNMPVPAGKNDNTTTVLLLPAFTYIDNVSPASVPSLITHYINAGPTTTSPLPSTLTLTTPPLSNGAETYNLQPRPCPHKYLILLCSQRTRDARCGQSAPLLKREFERHLRPLGLYRDSFDERPGGVGIYFISHVGGHKYSANCFVYRRAGTAGTLGAVEENAAHGGGKEARSNGMKENGFVPEEHMNGSALGFESGDDEAADPNSEAAQCIWLARVRPEDCENIIRYTVLQGKVVKPERQLRGGFDRSKGLVSW